MSTASEERLARLATLPLVRIGRSSGGFVGAFRQIGEIFAHREMLGLLVRRDLKARYKDSVLGFVWTLVRPITQLVIYYVAIGKFLGAERGIPDFAIYVFTGLTVYGLFQEIVAGGTSSVVANTGLVKKIYLPREVFPIASVGGALVNFGVQLIVLLAATVILGRIPLSPDLVYAIPAFLVILTFGTALALLLSAVNVYLRDVQYLVEVVLLVLLWASPVVYTWETVRDVLGHSIWLTIYTDNPITLAVLGFQRAFWVSGHDAVAYPDNLMGSLWIAVAVGTLAILGCQQVFARLQGNFAQAL